MHPFFDKLLGFVCRHGNSNNIAALN